MEDVKKICIAEQFHPTSPKQVLQSAFEMELIQDNYIWQAMINDKNYMAHVYQRSLARDIYYKVDIYYKHMNQAYLTIKQKYDL